MAVKINWQTWNKITSLSPYVGYAIPHAAAMKFNSCSGQWGGAMNFVGADSMGAIVPTACGGDAIIFAPHMSLIKSTKEDTKRANMRAKNCSVSAS